MCVGDVVVVVDILTFTIYVESSLDDHNSKDEIIGQLKQLYTAIKEISVVSRQ